MRDPGKRPQIWNYPINQQDEIRRAYIKFGPYQFIMDEYPLSGLESHPRRFKAHWFKSFSWLEYSPEVDAAFCLPCYLFSRKSSPFTSGGFRNWKKVNNGKDCAFLSHVGKSLNSPHNIAVKSCKDLLNQLCHIDKVLAKQSSQQVLSNRLRLKASIDTVKWLTFQACAFRGHDESHESQNLEDLATNGSTYSQRGDATYALKSLLSFDFVFILHMMKEIMGITDKLCQALQQKSQDILNAMHLVSSTKSLIQQLRDSSWGALLEKVSSFCNDHAIQIPDMGASFSDIIRSRRKKDVVTVEHHYRVDIFTSVIDFQLKELNSRFSEQATELLILSTSLDPKDAFKLFSVCNICNLVKNFYSLYAIL
ncbi:uncharacterized protein [Arachis hypogaea]|uniref:uncharacterized protein n=1 Tax=Arachis hypogaea TaxID=3818 RepID=UPI003B20C403